MAWKRLFGEGTAQDAAMRSKLATYLASESTLRKVARLQLPEAFTIAEDAEMRFDNGRHVRARRRRRGPGERSSCCERKHEHERHP